MSSDGKPLWGFRKIFFLCGLVYGTCAVWSVWGLVAPDPEFARTSPPGSENHLALSGFGVVCGLLSAACFWFWRQLRRQRFTSRIWIIGLLLQLPLLLIPPLGLLALVVWCSLPCRKVFHQASLTRIGGVCCRRRGISLQKIGDVCRGLAAILFCPVVLIGFILRLATKGRYASWLVSLTGLAILGVVFPAAWDWPPFGGEWARHLLRLIPTWYGVSLLIGIGFELPELLARLGIRKNGPRNSNSHSKPSESLC